MSLSNLPPGVSQRDIDRYFSGPCDDCLDGRHEECEDSECRCEDCEQAARDDYYESLAEEARERRLLGE